MRIRWVIGGALFVWVLAVHGRPVGVAQKFMQHMQTCYCDAGWICKDLSRMSINDAAACWQRTVALMTDHDMQWFYCFDTAMQYEQALCRPHRSFENFVDNSVDVLWLEECRQYHEWLTTHIVDNVSGRLLEKGYEWDKEACSELSAILWAIAPESMSAFYLFYFEKQVNALFKKLNYVATEPELQTNHLSSVMQDKTRLKRLYTICIHQTKQLSETAARELAYHYRRVDDVYDETMLALAERVGARR